MRLPTRRAEKLRTYDDTPVYMTGEGIEKLKRKIARLKRDLPEAIAEVTRTAAMGDLSENAAYSIAKATMRRMQTSLLFAQERLKQVVEIFPDPTSDVAQLGSTVTTSLNGSEQIFHLVGPQEADPLRGSISYVSPLGRALVNARMGDHVTVETPSGAVVYQVINVNNKLTP